MPSATPLGALADPPPYDPSHILVCFESGFKAEKTMKAGAQLGLALRPDLYQVDLPATLSVSRALALFRGNRHVVYAEPDYELSLNLTPNDPSFNVEWGLNNTGQSGGVVDADIDAAEAWDTTTGSYRTIVAVIDTGVDYTHVDLYQNIWINQAEIPTAIKNALTDVDGDSLFTLWDLNDAVNQGAGKIGDLNGNGYIDGGDLLKSTSQGGWADGLSNDGDAYKDDLIGWDFVNNDNDPYDDNSHGTHVAGTIGALSDNGSGVAGINWQVEIMALKFLAANGSGSTSNAAKALDYAVAHGAQLSNNSWGGGGYSSTMYNSISKAGQAGHIFVAAAGNSGANNDSSAFYPASYNLDNIVAVAATDRTDSLASYSNYGATTVDLAAPGTSIYSTTPNNGYGYKSGTSMATPHVTGALALLCSYHPDWSTSQLIGQLLDTVDPLAGLNGKVVSGGRLNLGSALAAPSQPTLSISDVTVVEGNSGTTNAVFTVTLSAASSQTVTVNYATADGTAKVADGDYAAASGALTFDPGVTTQTFTVLVSGDTLIESHETFTVTLSSPVNAGLAGSQAAGTIANDDTEISLSGVTLAEGNSGASNAVFTVTLAKASAVAVTVDFATTDGTAKAADSDYTAANGTLTFAPGETSKTIAVAITGDIIPEADEDFSVGLSNATGATLAKTSATAMIKNDDYLLTIDDVIKAEGNSGTTTFTFTVTLSSARTDATVTVDWSTANGAAKTPGDYVKASGTLTFKPGETSKTITIEVKGDTTAEKDESFFVRLTNAKNAMIDAKNKGTGTIVNDD